MNNSLHFEIEEVSQEKPDERVQEREAKLVRMIEALSVINDSREWSTLKKELFDGVLETIESRQRTEAEKSEVSLPEMYRLQGEKKWAKRYSNFDDLINNYRAELANIRKLNPPDPEEMAGATNYGR